jgi:hypothetical protein
MLDLEDVSFLRGTGEAPPLEDSGYLGDAGYVMSKFTLIVYICHLLGHDVTATLTGFRHCI